MPKTYFVKPVSLFLFSVLFTIPQTVSAQKLSRKALRALRAQEATELTNLTKGAISSNASFRAALKETGASEIIRPPRSKRPQTSYKQRKKFFQDNNAKWDQRNISTVIRRQIAPFEKDSYKNLPFDPYEKFEQILTGTKNPIKALETVKGLEDLYPGYSFFSIFASVYYNQHFHTLTPHLKKLFKHVESLQSAKLESRMIQRMRFLTENQENFRNFFAPGIHPYGMRIRYLKDISKLTAENFNPNHLVFAFEQRMLPRKHPYSIRHINVNSVFHVGPYQQYSVYKYNGPFGYLPILYCYLLNGTNNKKELTIFWDKKEKSMAIYNEDKTLWLRISSHEYSSPERLHIHLNEIHTAEMVTTLGLTKKETVNFNLSIPISVPPNLPAKHRSEFLYQEMIVKPIQHLKGNKHIKIIEKSIF